MGRKTYLGGSTVLHGGSSFFSRDKASTINAEKDFLLSCIVAEINNKPYPNSYTQHKKLTSSISKAGGVSAWIKKHPEYLKIRKKKLRQNEKKKGQQILKKKRKTEIKKRQLNNVEKQKKRELEYLKDYIWSQLLERGIPQNKPKGFSKKYPTNETIFEWAKKHERFSETYQRMFAKRSKQLAKIQKNIKTKK